MTDHEKLVEDVRGILRRLVAPYDHQLAEILIATINPRSGVTITNPLPKVGEPVMVLQSKGDFIPKTVVRVLTYAGRPAFEANNGIYLDYEEGHIWKRVDLQEDINKLKDEVSSLRAELLQASNLYADSVAEINKLKREHAEFRDRSIANGALLELELAKEKTAKETAQLALNHYKASFKELHDCVMKKYPVEAWGKDVTQFAISKLEAPITVESALNVLKDNGWEEKSIITNGKIVLAKPAERIPKVGDWIWTGWVICGKTGADEPLQNVKVCRCDHEKFWVDHNDFSGPRFFEDLGKSWFWDKPSD